MPMRQIPQMDWGKGRKMAIKGLEFDFGGEAEETIQNVINKAYEWEDGRYHGMTYEQGIRDALRWILGEEKDEPLSKLPDRNPDFKG